MSCPYCPHCTNLPTLATGLRPTAALLQVAAPPGALDRLMRWVESLRGTKASGTLTCTLVASDGEWVSLVVQREPEVIGRGRRRPVAGGGVDGGPPSGVPSGHT